MSEPTAPAPAAAIAEGPAGQEPLPAPAGLGALLVAGFVAASRVRTVRLFIGVGVLAALCLQEAGSTTATPGGYASAVGIALFFLIFFFTAVQRLLFGRAEVGH